jgi:hypothetical protein
MTDDEYLKQGEARVEEYLTMVNSIIDLMPEPRRSQVKKMMDGPMGEQFMTAPASTKRKFHYAFPCGLVAHSLNVVRNAWKIADALWPNRWPKWQIAFVALFHDLGKAGSPGKPYYVQQKDEYWRRKGEFYEVSQEEYMPNAEKSLYVLQLHGVTLTHEETVAIRLNDGMGPEENRGYEFREPDLALVTHWADHASMRMEKAENK